MQEKVYKVAISIPSEGHTLPEAYDNHLVLSFHLGKMQEKWKNEKRNPRYEFYWYTTGRLMTAMAREKLMSEAIKNKMDYVVMFDDDMILPIDMIEAMLYDCENHPEIDVMGALAFMRNPPHHAVIYVSHEGYDNVRHQKYFFNEFYKNYPKDKLVECDAVGFGAVIINMRILSKMKAPYFFSTTGSGEDIYFCYKAKQEAGARVFMDTRIKLGHISKPTIIDEEYYQKFLKDNKVPIPEIPHKYLSYDK